MKKLFTSLILTLMLTACGGDATKTYPVSFSQLNGWKQDSLSTPFKLFVDSCRVNANRGAKAYRSLSEGAVGDRAKWDEACSRAYALGEADDVTARQFFETNFTPYKVETEQLSTGLITGYYEPIINGSTVRKAPYLTPVYGLPSDLHKPYLTREQIVHGAIKGRAPVLYYVDDPVLLFFLHVQGSGKVRLPDGHLEGIQYAGQNGYSYTPIGRVLKDRGDLQSVSMQSIRDWLKTHPDQMDEVMNQNQSYVFFKKGPGDRSAKGALGIPLTPLRSIAVDDDRAAYGVPTFIDTTQSQYQTGRQIPLQRLFVSQDTGGALHSPHRADLFYGQGTVEEWQAGHQNARGLTYWLLPEPSQTPQAVPTTPPQIVAPATPETVTTPVPPAELPKVDMPPAEKPPAPVVIAPDASLPSDAVAYPNE